MTNEITLYGTVGADFWGDDHFTAKEVRASLAEMSGDVTVRINSGGGVAPEGAAIYQALANYPDKVTVVVDGAASSAASLIAMAGDEIIMPLGSWMLIHDPAMGFTEGRGTADDHAATAEALDIVGEGYAGVYAKRAGMSEKKARKVMKAETYLSPAAAVEMGFADRTDEGLQAAAAAPFPYQIYANAPEGVRNVSGDCPDMDRLMVAMAGKPKTSNKTKEPQMAVKEKAAPEGPVAKVGAAAPETPVDVDAIRADAEKAAVERASRIYALGRQFGAAPQMVDELVRSGASLDTAVDKFGAEMRETAGDDGKRSEPRPSATVTADAEDKFAEGVGKALMAKANIPGGERNEFSGMTLTEMGRASMEVRGRRVTASSKLDVVGSIFGARMEGGGHSTSDFTSILENIAGKAMLRGFEEQAETFEMWTSTGTLSDFKITKRVGLDVFPALTEVLEGAEYNFATVGDYAEPVVLATYGKMFSITRQAVINDDLNAFTSIPMKMGRAARRTVGNLAYAVLTGNPDMADSTALFHADHGNLAGSGAAPSVATVNAGLVSMATQTDRSGNATALNIRPQYILAPYALRSTILQVLNSEHDPSKTGRTVNTARNAVEPIFDARLDSDSAAAWYLAASPSVGDTVEISYLDGNSAPFLDSKDGWSVDGAEFKVRIDAAAKALAWEGLYKNAGE